MLPCLSPSHVQAAQYLVFMDSYNYEEDGPCEELLASVADAFQGATPENLNRVLNDNQLFKRHYSYVDSWYKCCNESNLCNDIVNPPTFVYNPNKLTLSSCNAFNLNRGWRFVNKVGAAAPITQTSGNFTDCYSVTLQLTRGSQVRCWPGHESLGC